jgi:predicted Rossmann-fold nucleotide-binding protein
LEVITLKQLGRFAKPIFIINTNGFYNALLHVFEEMIERRFMRDMHRNIWTVIDRPEQLLESYGKLEPWVDSTREKLV